MYEIPNTVYTEWASGVCLFMQIFVVNFMCRRSDLCVCMCVWSVRVSYVKSMVRNTNSADILKFFVL